MIRTGLVVAILAGVLLACGGRPIVPEVAVEHPTTSPATTPYPVAVVEGRTGHASTLVLAITSDGQTFTFETAPGLWLAFRHDASSEPRPTVAWPDAAPMSPRTTREDLQARVEALGLAGASTLSADGRAVVVAVGEEGAADLASIVRGLAQPGGDLRFLIHVQPEPAYPPFDGETAPRLARGEAPWRESAEAFSAFKQHEVEAWLDARRAGRPYVPSRPAYVVLPRADVEGAPSTASDFEVLEWPADEAHRVDRTWVEQPQVVRGESGRPEIWYEIAAPHQDAFFAWTEANVGLPMAIVLDDRFVSAPTIQSPLRDRVRVTLGSQSTQEEARREADRLVTSLRVGRNRATARLAAAVTWREDGHFEVVVPLRAPETVLALQAVDAAGRESDPSTQTLLFRPNTEGEAARAVSSVLPAVELGLLGLDAGADYLRPFGDGAIGALGVMVYGDDAATVPARRQDLAVELAGRLDLQSEVTLSMLRAVARRAERSELRRRAVDALARLRPLSPTAHQILRGSLRDVDAEVRQAAARALLEGDLDGTAALGLLLPLAAEDEDGLFDVVAMHVMLNPEASLATLLAEAVHTSPPRRRAAAALLGNVPDERARGALLRLQEESDPDVRRAAAWALALFHDIYAQLPRLAIEEVLQRLDADPVEPRAWAASSLAAYGEAARPHVETLRALLDDEAEEVRVAAAWALGQLGVEDPRAQAILQAAIEGAKARAAGR